MVIADSTPKNAPEKTSAPTRYERILIASGR